MKLIITINGETRVLLLKPEAWQKVKDTLEKAAISLDITRDNKTKEIVDFK